VITRSMITYNAGPATALGTHTALVTLLAAHRRRVTRARTRDWPIPDLVTAWHFTQRGHAVTASPRARDAIAARRRRPYRSRRARAIARLSSVFH
jgi:hypothetical protein